MRAKEKPQNELNFLAHSLNEQPNPKNELYLLCQQMHWNYFEKEFKPLYSKKGSPAHSICLMRILIELKPFFCIDFVLYIFFNNTIGDGSNYGCMKR